MRDAIPRDKAGEKAQTSIGNDISDVALNEPDKATSESVSVSVPDWQIMSFMILKKIGM